MSKSTFFPGFSRLSDEEKARLIASLCDKPDAFLLDIREHKHPRPEIQEKYSTFSENTLSNFFIPFGIAPNFLINDTVYHIPMAIEESSVVAAAASAAKFWAERGGFRALVTGTIKKGQVHFLSEADCPAVQSVLSVNKERLQESVKEITRSMEARGGGILDIELKYLPEIMANYYQLEVSFETRDAMGANFINSVLEGLAGEWENVLYQANVNHEMLMAILSNYTPECRVECFVETRLKNLEAAVPGYSGEEFARRFVQAVQIAEQDVNRAVTHNKGIFNGIDAVVIATGNDFRAVEANGHAYAARSGHYRSLSHASMEGDVFRFALSMPLAVGTTGGLTHVHPMARRAMEILGWPGATELMGIIAAAGLANNFSAVRALTSKGIQAGHMKLHLSNILSQLNADPQERKLITEQFREKTVSYMLVRKSLEELRNSGND